MEMKPMTPPAYAETTDEAPKADVLGVLLAAGLGERLGEGLPKGFRALLGRPLLHHGLRLFEACPSVARVVLVVPEGYLDEARRLCPTEAFPKLASIIHGGKTRQESCFFALEADDLSLAFVAVHDAARPLTTPSLAERVIAAARKAAPNGGAVPVSGISDSVYIKRDDRLDKVLDRRAVRCAQTPQVFGLSDLHNVQRQARTQGLDFTDEASLMAHYGFAVALVEHDEENPKMTTQRDWTKAESDGHALRVGQGFDAHRLVQGRPLILAGVNVPHDKGLLGHSDADVLTHALADALLGACGLGDLGDLFPSDDPVFEGADSLKLLAKVVGRCHETGFTPLQADCTLVAEVPRLADYRATMRENLARVLGLSVAKVSVKFKTTEGLGFCGREEGMAAMAVATMKERTT